MKKFDYYDGVYIEVSVFEFAWSSSHSEISHGI